MRKYLSLGLCAVFVALRLSGPAQSQEGFDANATERAAFEVERAWLNHEIGRFASGREAIFSGELTVTQRDLHEIIVMEGKAFAALSLGSPQTLTVVFPNEQRWLRLTQDRDKPNVTSVSRLRPLHANIGVSATCTDCIRFAALNKEPLFLRLAAQGELLDVARSRFVVEIAGFFERIPPEALRLDHLLLLRPDLEAWVERPDQPFQIGRREAVRDIAAVLRQRAPAPSDDTVRFTCNYETRYTAQHYVDLNDLTRFGVRNLTLGDTDLCCVDHTRHDGGKICDGEFLQ